MPKPRYGLLIDYEFCTGCHTCEVACKQENELPVGVWGIRVIEVGPTPVGDRQMLYYFPFPTDNCDLCAQRVEKGLQPSCVKHCLSGIMKFGTIEDLAKLMREKPRTVLWVPR